MYVLNPWRGSRIKRFYVEDDQVTYIHINFGNNVDSDVFSAVTPNCGLRAQVGSFVNL